MPTENLNLNIRLRDLNKTQLIRAFNKFGRTIRSLLQLRN